MASRNLVLLVENKIKKANNLHRYVQKTTELTMCACAKWFYAI